MDAATRRTAAEGRRQLSRRSQRDRMTHHTLPAPGVYVPETVVLVFTVEHCTIPDAESCAELQLTCGDVTSIDDGAFTVKVDPLRSVTPLESILKELLPAESSIVPPFESEISSFAPLGENAILTTELS